MATCPDLAFDGLPQSRLLTLYDLNARLLYLQTIAGDEALLVVKLPGADRQGTAKCCHINKIKTM
jgi:hypothetical protein